MTDTERQRYETDEEIREQQAGTKPEIDPQSESRNEEGSGWQGDQAIRRS